MFRNNFPGATLFLSLFTSGVMVLAVSTCDLTAITTCTSILGRSTNVSVMSEGLSAIPTVEQLRALCGSLTEFKECYQPKAAACSNDVIFSMTFGTVEKTIDYLCKEGFNDIVEHAPCWNQTEVTVDTTNCHVVQSEMIELLQQRSSQLNSTEMRDSWCEILTNTTRCMSNAVESRCGSAPACIMHTMMSRALDGLAGLMKCPAPVPCVIDSGTTPVRGDGPTTTVSHSNKSGDSGVSNTDTKLSDAGFRENMQDSSNNKTHTGQRDLDNGATAIVFSTFSMYTISSYVIVFILNKLFLS